MSTVKSQSEAHPDATAKINVLKKVNSMIEEIRKGNDYSIIYRYKELKKLEEHNDISAIGMLTEFLFDDSRSLRESAAHILSRPPHNLKQSSTLTLGFLQERSASTRERLFNELSRIMSQSEIEYSDVIGQEGNYRGRHCIRVLRNIIGSSSNAVFDKPIGDYVVEHQDGEMYGYIMAFLESRDRFLVRLTIRLLGNLGQMEPRLYSILCEHLDSTDHLEAQDAIKSLVSFAQQAVGFRTQTAKKIYKLATTDLARRYKDAEHADHVRVDCLLALGTLGTYKELQEASDYIFHPPTGTTGKRESFKYIQRAFLEALREIYDSEEKRKNIEKLTAVQSKILIETMKYMTYSDLKSKAIQILTKLASPLTVEYLMDSTALRHLNGLKGLVILLSSLFEKDSVLSGNCPPDLVPLKEHVAQRIKQCALLTDEDFFDMKLRGRDSNRPKGRRGLKKECLRALYMIDREILITSDIDALRSVDPDPAFENTHYTSFLDETALNEIINSSEDKDQKYHAEVELIISYGRGEVSSALAERGLSDLWGYRKRKLIPRLCRIESENAVTVLRSILNQASGGVGIAIRESIGGYQSKAFYKDFINELSDRPREIGGSDAEKLPSLAYKNLLKAANYELGRGRNLFEERRRIQQEQADAIATDLWYKTLLKDLMADYHEETAGVIYQTESEIGIADDSEQVSKEVLFFTTPNDGNQAKVFARPLEYSPESLNYLNRFVNDYQIKSAIQQDKGFHIAAIVGRIVGKKTDRFQVDIGLKDSYAYLPFGEIDFDIDVEKDDLNQYIGRIIEARIVKTDSDEIELSRIRYLKDKVLDELEDGEQINTKVLNWNTTGDRRGIEVEYKGHSFLIEPKHISYDPNREWDRTLNVGSPIEATVLKDPDGNVTLSLKENEPVYQLKHLLLNHGDRTKFKLACIADDKFEWLSSDKPGEHCRIPPERLLYGDDFLQMSEIGTGDILTVQFELLDMVGPNKEHGESENDEAYSVCSTEELVLNIEDISPNAERTLALRKGWKITGTILERSEDGFSLDLGDNVPNSQIRGRISGFLPREAEELKEGDSVTGKVIGYNKYDKIVEMHYASLVPSELQRGITYSCAINPQSIGSKELVVYYGNLEGKIPTHKISYDFQLGTDFFQDRRTVRAELDSIEWIDFFEGVFTFRHPEARRRFGLDVKESFLGHIVSRKWGRDEVRNEEGEVFPLNKHDFDFTDQYSDLELRFEDQIQISRIYHNRYLLKVKRPSEKLFTLLENVSPYDDRRLGIKNKELLRVVYAGSRDGCHRFEIEPGKIFRVPFEKIENLEEMTFDIGDVLRIRKVGKRFLVAGESHNILKELQRSGELIEAVIKSKSSDRLELVIEHSELRPFISGFYEVESMSDKDKERFPEHFSIDEKISVCLKRFEVREDNSLHIEFSGIQDQALFDIGELSRSFEEKQRAEEPLFLEGTIEKIGDRELEIKLKNCPDASCFIIEPNFSWDIDYPQRVERALEELIRTRRAVRGKVIGVDLSQNSVELSLKDNEPTEWSEFSLSYSASSTRPFVYVRTERISDKSYIVFEYKPGENFRIAEEFVKVQGENFAQVQGKDFDSQYISTHDIIVRYGLFDLKTSTEFIKGINILNIERSRVNQIAHSYSVLHGRYEGRSHDGTNEWIVRLPNNLKCYVILPQEPKTPTDLFKSAGRDPETGKIYLVLCKEFVQRDQIWVTVDDAAGNRLKVKYGNDQDSLIRDYDISWGSTPLKVYSFSKGLPLLCTIFKDQRGGNHFIPRKNRAAHFSHLEAHKDELKDYQIFTYYQTTRDGNILLEVKPGVNVAVPQSHITGLANPEELKQGDRFEAQLDHDDNGSILLRVQGKIKSEFHYIDQGMLLKIKKETSNRYQDQLYRLQGYNQLLAQHKTSKDSPSLELPDRILEVARVGSNSVFLQARRPSRRGMYVVAKNPKIEGHGIIVETSQGIQGTIPNQEITYEVGDIHEIKERFTEPILPDQPFTCRITGRSRDKIWLSLKQNPPLPSAYLNGKSQLDLVFVGIDAEDAIFEQTWGTKIAIPLALIERRGERIQDLGCYSPGDLFKVEVVDLQRGALTLKGINVYKVELKSLHHKFQKNQFTHAEITWVSKKGIEITVNGTRAYLSQDKLLEEYRNSLGELKRGAPICVEITEVSEGVLDCEQRENDITRYLKARSIFEGKVGSRDGTDWKVEIPGNREIYAILPKTEVGWKSYTHIEDGKDNTYSDIVAENDQIRVIVTEREEKYIEVSRAALIDRIFDPSAYRVGTILEGCVKTAFRSCVLISFKEIDLIVEATGVMWGTQGVFLERGDKVETRILNINKDERAIDLSIKQANRAFGELPEGHFLDAKVYRVLNHGIIAEYNGSLAYVNIRELAWCYIKDVSDVFQVGDNIRVYKISRQGDEEVYSLRANPALVRYSKGERIEMAKIRNKTEHCVYVEIDKLISSIPRRDIEADVYENLNNGDVKTLEIVDIEYLRKRIDLRIAEIVVRGPGTGGENDHTSVLDRNYGYAVGALLKDMEDRMSINGTESITDWLLSEINVRDLNANYTNVKRLFKKLYDLDENLIDTFLQSVQNHSQDTDNELACLLQIVAKMYQTQTLPADDSIDDLQRASTCFITGYIHYLKQQVLETIRYWSEAYKYDKNSLEITLGLAVIYGKYRNYEIHDRFLDRYMDSINYQNLLTLPEVWKTRIVKGDNTAGFESAVRKFEAGDVRAALKEFEYLGLEPHLASAIRFNNALCHAVLGEYDRAESRLQEIEMHEMRLDESYYKLSLHTAFQQGDFVRFRRGLETLYAELPHSCFWQVKNT